MAALVYHGPSHQYPLAPDFTKEALSDDAPVNEAIAKVLKVRAKKPAESTRLKKALDICQPDIKSVGQLREWSDSQWSVLKAPLMFKLYLKHLVKQSIGLTPLQQLECDFNRGNPLDWSAYTAKLESLANMGFSRAQSIEALIVTGNKGIDVACNFLFLGIAEQKQQREAAKKELNKAVPPHKHFTQIDLMKRRENRPSSPSVSANGQPHRQKTVAKLRAEVKAFEDELRVERTKRRTLQKTLEDEVAQLELKRYHAFMMGITADGMLNSAEVQEYQAYRSKRKISEDTHKKVLQLLEHTEESFEAIKNLEDFMADEQECIICFDGEKDHLVIGDGCSHLCLCGVCAQEVMATPEPTCPICNTQIQRIAKVYM